MVEWRYSSTHCTLELVGQAPTAILLGEAHPVQKNRILSMPQVGLDTFYERKISCPSQEMSDCLVIQPTA